MYVCTRLGKSASVVPHTGDSYANPSYSVKGSFARAMLRYKHYAVATVLSRLKSATLVPTRL